LNNGGIVPTGAENGLFPTVPTAPQEVFNAAKDSQLANEQLGLSPYSGSVPSAVDLGTNGGIIPTGAVNGVVPTIPTGGGLVTDWLTNNARGLLSGLGGYLNSQSSLNSANNNASDILAASQKAADLAKFKPFGTSSRFGSSNFGYDANGNLTSAGYTLSPEMKAQQDRLMNTSNGMLSQFEGSQATTAPMGTAAQSMFNLGNQYLTSSPQEQAAKWMRDQQALLAGTREQQLSGVQNKLQQQGRLGLATGGTSTGLMATNPEMAAYYNALNQQDLGLAANATQAGQQYAQFGADMVNRGGNTLQNMYGTQNAAYTPYQTALTGATNIENLGMQPLTTSLGIANAQNAANTNAGRLLVGGQQAASTMLNNAQQATGNPWGNFLTGIGNL
jgi:hypothetical protein